MERNRQEHVYICYIYFRRSWLRYWYSDHSNVPSKYHEQLVVYAFFIQYHGFIIVMQIKDNSVNFFMFDDHILILAYDNKPIPLVLSNCFIQQETFRNDLEVETFGGCISINIIFSWWNLHHAIVLQTTLIYK